MTQIEKIKKFMQGKEKVHVKDIVLSLNINLNSVRGVVNASIIKDINFIRLGNGFYKLKE